jgi:hypothetical protein
MTMDTASLIPGVAALLTTQLQGFLTVLLLVWVWRLDRRLAIICARLESLLHAPVDSRD